MIKQLNNSTGSTTKFKADWPEDIRENNNLFVERSPLRKIKILVDAELLMQSTPNIQETKITHETVLQSLLNHNLVRCYKYSDDGPPSSESPINFNQKTMHPCYAGWAVVHELKDSAWIVTIGISTKEGLETIAWDYMPQIARDLTITPEEARFLPEQRSKDVLAVHVASDALQADLYITKRPYLYSGTKLAVARGLTTCTPEEAITIIALYLRTQGEFVIPSPPSILKSSLGRSLYFWIGTRELLPEAWRWFSACVQCSTASKDNKLMLLGGSVLSRVTRALQARDEVHTALNKSLNNDSQDDALGSLDSVLSLLMGAVDASARVANKVTEIGFDDWNVGWQKSAWLLKLQEKAPNLAGLVTNNANGTYALTILRLFRNNVHGIALQGMSMLQDGEVEMLVGIPHSDETEILHAMDALGGKDGWGVRSVLPGSLHLEAAVFVDRLFEEIMKLLNNLMEKTPVEILPNVKILPKDKVPPIDNPDAGIYNTFSEWNRNTIRMHLGF